MPLPRTVVFDLGGVLLRWQPDLLIRHVLSGRNGQGPPAEVVLAKIFEDFSMTSDWAQFDRGRYDIEGLVERVSCRAELEPELVRGILDAVPAHMRMNPDTVALLRQVRAVGHRIVYLSNMPTPFADLLEQDPDFGALFDGGVFSCRVGAIKPEPEIFRIARQRLDLDPSSIVLIDDRRDNLAQAEALGWPGLQFVDAHQCAADLSRLGWL